MFCTVDSEALAEEIGDSLVDGRLAACAQVVGPIRSTYRWQGEVETAAEWLLLIKTTATRFDALRDAILARHGYQVPEVVAVPIEAGLPAYLDWVEDSTS